MLDRARVLVVGDGDRTNLVEALEAEGCSVESTGDGRSGETAAREGGYDLILLELPRGEEGLELCRGLRRSRAATPIVVLGEGGTSADEVASLRAGADDYLGKPFDSSVLVARMEAVLRRAGPEAGAIGEALVRFGEFCLDRRRGELTREGRQVPLNAQEYRLLAYLSANPNRVVGREEMLDLVWGYEHGTATRTIDVHIAKLRQRLGESELPRHILTVRGKGYKFVGPPGREPSSAGLDSSA